MKELQRLSDPGAPWRRHFDAPQRWLTLAAKGFFKDEGLYRASALAFDTVLGLVPFLAFFVTALKGLGAYQVLMRETIRPGIVRAMIAMGAQQDREAVGLLRVFLTVLDIVEQASFGTLGAFGLVFLLYIVVLLLVSVEETMNHIFGVTKARSLWRRLVDYAAILFILPICTIIAATAATRAEHLPGLRGGLYWQGSAMLVMATALTLLYRVVPYRRVRLRSAALAGLITGSVWYLILVVHVHFQIGVARYNALYSTFAAIPLFLVWIFVSWIVVLFGAELAAAHDNPVFHAFRIRGTNLDHATRVFVVLRVLVAIAERFLSGQRPLTLSELAEQLALPGELLRFELERFVQAELLMRSNLRGEPTYALARDIDSLRLGELLALVERDQPAPQVATRVEQRLANLIETRVLMLEPSTHQLTLRELVGLLHGAE